MNNLKQLIEEQVNPIINIEETKELANLIQGETLTTFEKSLIYANNVYKLRTLLKDSTFKQVAKDSYQIDFGKIEEGAYQLLGIKKAWFFRLCQVTKLGTNETLQAYKKHVKIESEEKGSIAKYSIDGYANFLTRKDKKEEKEESKEAKIEKVKKLIEKLGLSIEDIK